MTIYQQHDIIGSYGQEFSISTPGDLNKEHCLVITVTLSSGRSLKEITCYLPGIVVTHAALCLHTIVFF